MKPAEQKYAMSRIDDLCDQKLRMIEESMPVIKAKKITYEQAVRKIKKGEIKLCPAKKNRPLHNYDDFEDIFDLNGHHDYRSSDTYDKKAYKKKEAPVLIEAQRIKDQIMLGDATEALKMIEAFAKMYL